MSIDADEAAVPAGASPREGPTEPISPELVLVSPELRYLLPPTRWNPRVDRLEPLPAPQQDAPVPATEAPSAHVVVRLIGYAAWQTLMGALFGLAAVGALVGLIAALTFLR